jgi:hypothetical protein
MMLLFIVSPPLFLPADALGTDVTIPTFDGDRG